MSQLQQLSSSEWTLRRGRAINAFGVQVPPSYYRRRTFQHPSERYLSNRGSPVIPNPHDKPVMSAEEAFAELGIDRSTGYKAIREGNFPLPIIRIGRLIRVPTIAVRRLLQLDRDPAGTSRPVSSPEDD